MATVSKKALAALLASALGQKAAKEEIEDTAGRSIKEILQAAQKEKAARSNMNKDYAPGQATARMVRAFAAAKGDPERAGRTLKKWGDDTLAKAMTSGDFDDGGFVIAPQFSEEVIELLRPFSVVRASNPLIVPMPGGSVTIPKITGGATSGYVGESQSSRASGMKGGNLSLSWKKLRTTVPMSRELIMTAANSADQMVLQDMLASMGQTEDQTFIRSAGGEYKPKGLRYWAPAANVIASAGTSAANIETDLVAAIQALEGSNVRMLRPGWLISTRTKNNLINKRTANDVLVFPEMRTSSPSLYQLPVKVTNNIPSNLTDGNDTEIYLVDFADAVIGETTSISIEVSEEATYTDATGTLVSAFDRDEVVIKVVQRHDFGMRHDESVAVITGVNY